MGSGAFAKLFASHVPDVVAQLRSEPTQDVVYFVRVFRNQHSCAQCTNAIRSVFVLEGHSAKLGLFWAHSCVK